VTVPAEQAVVAAFLEGLAGSPPVETHISAVFRGADTVWKLKKAVRLGFLDFSDLGERRRFLDRELALNAPFVPGLYRDVIAVTRGDAGLMLGGDGPVLDWVLRMARVPDGDFLDAMAADGRLDPLLLLAIADGVAAMHAAQATVPGVDSWTAMRGVAAGNARAALAAGLNADAVAAWEAGIMAALDRAAPCLRARSGLVRRAHGDLHLGNLLMWQGRPAPFDALEFDEALATIDPGYDLAFLLMDLDQRVGRAAANLVLSRYVARTGDAGLAPALAPFLSLRAMIRAHVEAARQGDGGYVQEARRSGGAGLLAAAMGYLAPARPVVLAIGGLMGAGKSTLARMVAPTLGAAPGALVLRSDEIRKRLFGAAPEDRLPKAAYGSEANQRTAAAMLAGVAAAAGAHCVIADATFLAAPARTAIEAAARAAGAAFLGIWLDAPLAELERRVAARHGDASDADIVVLRRAAAAYDRPSGWACLDATDLAAAERQVQLLLGVL
jgi:aminoglycoside phosphotransferase family enzyme/predicted kinase